MSGKAELSDFVTINIAIKDPPLYPVFVPIEALAQAARECRRFPDYQIFAYLQSGGWVSICALGHTEVVVEKNGRLL